MGRKPEKQMDKRTDYEIRYCTVVPPEKSENVRTTIVKVGDE